MLKALTIALIFATSFESTLQSATVQQAPDVEVVKYHWSKERIGWERDPFGGPLENFDEMRARARNEKRIDDSKRGGGVDADRLKREAQTDAAIVNQTRRQPPARYQFLYKFSVMNRGPKRIKEIDFDYVFLDAVTGEELGRREFTGVEKIAPGKTKEISFMISAAPFRRISVHALDKNERVGLTEKVLIMRIIYDDGSVWKRP